MSTVNTSANENIVTCPVCDRSFSSKDIMPHVNNCIFLNSRDDTEITPKKRKRSSPGFPAPSENKEVVNVSLEEMNRSHEENSIQPVCFPRIHNTMVCNLLEICTSITFTVTDDFKRERFEKSISGERSVSGCSSPLWSTRFHRAWADNWAGYNPSQIIK